MKMNPSTQAKKIIDKFGGVRGLCDALAEQGHPVEESTVYRWTYPITKRSGTGGLIPVCNIPYILRAARAHGIMLTDEDWRI